MFVIVYNARTGQLRLSHVLSILKSQNFFYPTNILAMEDIRQKLLKVLQGWPLSNGWDPDEGLDGLDDRLQAQFWAIYVRFSFTHRVERLDLFSG
jgi:hypothetical protein